MFPVQFTADFPSGCRWRNQSFFAWAPDYYPQVGQCSAMRPPPPLLEWRQQTDALIELVYGFPVQSGWSANRTLLSSA